MIRPRKTLFCLAGVLSLAMAGIAQAQEVADRIWSGGPVLTMNDDAMLAEAVAEKDGRIIAVGPTDAVMQHRGNGTQVFDLGGRAMVPGFVDSHGHVVLGGLQALSANLLAPPDGLVLDVDGLVTTLQAWTEENRQAVEAVNLIVGFGYDPAQLAEQRHPTAEDLDKVSADIPVYIVHQSGHIGVTNSAGLEALGLNADSDEVPGGVIRRKPDGAPDGVLEGNVHFAALGRFLGSLGEEGFLEFGRAGNQALGELWIHHRPGRPGDACGRRRAEQAFGDGRT